MGYQYEEFIKAEYMAIQKIGQFVKACERWIKLPIGEWHTEALFRVYFTNKYDIFDAQRDSLHNIGVKNNAEIQETLDRTQVEVDELQLQLLAQSSIANQYHSVIDTVMSAQPQETDDTTIMSKMIAMTAHHQQEMVTMRAQVQQCYLANSLMAPLPPNPSLVVVTMRVQVQVRVQETVQERVQIPLETRTNYWLMDQKGLSKRKISTKVRECILVIRLRCVKKAS